MTVQILHGDCIEVMKTLPADSVDAGVMDPPYELGFMGKSWDSTGVAFNPNTWREVLRVLKPGAHLLAFSGSRTYHRMACAIEDAGFEIRDQIMWIFGSGFPKSHNLDGMHEGWGTALKPAHEPILLARKPLAGTVAGNMDTHGVGGLHIDACRIETHGEKPAGSGGRKSVITGDERQGAALGMYGPGGNGGNVTPDAGRWPANVIHDGSAEVLAAFPLAPGQQGALTGQEPSAAFGGVCYNSMARTMPSIPRGDSGSAARFFYCAKTSKIDRDEGISGLEKDFVQFQTANGTSGKASSISAGRKTKYKNIHPTVKPTALMRYLCRLVTPRGGTVLDPFMGSGSTGKAAVLEQMNFIGIDLDESYIKIAKQRIDFAAGALFGGQNAVV